MLMCQRSCDGAPNMPTTARTSRRNFACTLGVTLLLPSCAGMGASPASPGAQLSAIEQATGEISAKAENPASSSELYYQSETTKTAGLPFSDAVHVGDLLYLNNQIGNRPGEGFLLDGGFKAQFSQIMSNIDGVLEANDLSRADIVMCTVTVTDLSVWNELNRLWLANFPDNRLPARNVIGVTALPLGATVGVQCVAAYSSGEPSQ